MASRERELAKQVRRTLGLDTPAEEGVSAPDRLSDNPWEGEVARLLTVVGDRNRSILELHERLELRDERVQQLTNRLQTTDAALPTQASAGDVRATTAAGAPANLVTRLAAEKGILESQLRKLRHDYDRLATELRQSRSATETRERSLAKLEAAAEERAQSARKLETQLADAESASQGKLRRSETELQRLAEALERASSRAKSAGEAAEKASEVARASEQQAALYRRNLVQAEESLKTREGEVTALRREVAELKQSFDEGERLRKSDADNHRGLVRALEKRLGEADARAKTAIEGRVSREKELVEARELTRKLEQEKARYRQSAGVEHAARTRLDAQLSERTKVLNETEAQHRLLTQDLLMMEEAWLAAKQLLARAELAALQGPAKHPSQQQSATEGGSREKEARSGSLLSWLRGS